MGLNAQRYDERDADVFDFTRVVGMYRRRSRSGLGIGSWPCMSAVQIQSATTVVQCRFISWRPSAEPTRSAVSGSIDSGTVGNLLLNFEYRWEVWTYADFVFFYDAGKVFSDANDLDLSNLKSGYWFGIRGRSPDGVVLRFDFARSNEGFILHIGGGPAF